MTEIVFAAILSVASWSAPQPQHSAGLLVTYGGQRLVEANADWHGYDLAPYPGRCGLASISPAHLGRIAWVRVPGRAWQGPCLVVDVVARIHAYESIYRRHEIAEVSRATAAALGFEYGAQGEVWFGACPPGAYSQARPYAPSLEWDYAPHERTPSYFPYPAQQRPADCGPAWALPWEARAWETLAQ